MWGLGCARKGKRMRRDGEMGKRGGTDGIGKSTLRGVGGCVCEGNNDY